MKMGFEFGILSFISMIFVSLLICLISVMMQQNIAKIYAEDIVDIIESNNGLNQNANTLIKELDYCDDCTYRIDKQDSKFRVTVNFPLKLTFVELDQMGEVYSNSRILNLN